MPVKSLVSSKAVNKIYPLFIPQVGCPFKCIYCHQHKITKTNEIDWENNLKNIENFITKYKNTPKEIAFFGGTFTCLSVKEMQEYFDKVLPFFDDDTYFRISTRPDAINDNILEFLQKNRVNTIELGVQSFSDIELSAANRGYSSQTAISSCQLIMGFGFFLSIQLMIGLPKADMNTYLDTIEILKRIKPQYVRLYPLLVIVDTDLAVMYQGKEYEPLSFEEAVNICILFLAACDEVNSKVIKIGLHSDIDSQDILAGPFHPRFGEIIKKIKNDKKVLDTF